MFKRIFATILLTTTFAVAQSPNDRLHQTLHQKFLTLDQLEDLVADADLSQLAIRTAIWTHLVIKVDHFSTHSDDPHYQNRLATLIRKTSETNADRIADVLRYHRYKHPGQSLLDAICARIPLLPGDVSLIKRALMKDDLDLAALQLSSAAYLHPELALELVEFVQEIETEAMLLEPAPPPGPFAGAPRAELTAAMAARP